MSVSLVLVTTHTNTEDLDDIKEDDLILHHRQDFLSFISNFGRDVNGFYSMGPRNEQMDIELPDSGFINVYCYAENDIMQSVSFNIRGGFTDNIYAFLISILHKYGGRFYDVDSQAWWDLDVLNEALNE